MANALARETSPYLLQHRDNPVDWLPWGEEALRRGIRAKVSSFTRGHINATTSLDDGLVLIEASVPEAELARYVLDLRSLTGGRAELSIAPDRFEVCPDHLVPA